MLLKVLRYFRKVVQVRLFEVSQSSYSILIGVGSWGRGLLKPNQTPCVLYCKHRLQLDMYALIAQVRGVLMQPRSAGERGRPRRSFSSYERYK